MTADAEPLHTGYLPSESGYLRAAWALFFGGLATFTTVYCVQPLLPVFAHDFGISPATSALAVSATTLCLGIAGLVLGPLSDGVGRRAVMLSSLAASGVLTLAGALVSDWSHLLLLRALIGLAVAGLPATASAYLREEIHPDYASATIGMFIGGNAIGGMSGRLLTGALASWFGWRGALAGVGVLGVVAFLVAWALLPKARTQAHRSLHPRDLARNAVRMATEPGLLRLYATGLCTMGAFVAVFNAIGFRLAAPPFVLDVGVAGLLYLTFALGTVSSTVAGRLWKRWGPRAIVPAAMLIELTGALITGPNALWTIVVGASLLVVGFFAAHGTLSGWVTARASLLGPGTGQAGALYLFSYYLGFSLAGAAAGAAWSSGGWTGVLLLTAGLCLVGALLALSMRRVPSLRQPVEPPDTAA